MKIILICTIFTLLIFGSDATENPDMNVTEVQVFIVYAYNLPDRDDGNDINDPFLQIKDSAGREVFRSPTQDNVQLPVFDPVSFNVFSSEVYNIEVRDNDVGPDDSLGSVAVPGRNLVGGLHRLSNPVGGSVEFLWKYPTQQPPTTTTTTTTTTPRTTITTTTTTTTQRTTTTPTTTTPRTTTWGRPSPPGPCSGDRCNGHGRIKGSLGALGSINVALALFARIVITL